MCQIYYSLKKIVPSFSGFFASVQNKNAIQFLKTHASKLALDQI